MAAIEARVFEAGMPVAASMEKAAGAIARRIVELYPAPARVGILVGPGHNGGDALVVARELHLSGYEVAVCRPIAKAKDLTGQHWQYVEHLGIPTGDDVALVQQADLIIDGLFGFGQTRAIEGELAQTVDRLNQASGTRVSIDVPSGIHTDTGNILGTAIRADRTFCLGLWKQAFFQDSALECIGEAELLDIGIPLSAIRAELGESATLCRLSAEEAIAAIPLKRPRNTHKYRQGHLLLICGSRSYTGATILAALGARASGVGMLSIAVPESWKPMLSARVPEALVIGCAETEGGAIARLPEDLDLTAYSAIACGPGLTTSATQTVKSVLTSDRPVVLDADGLNILATSGLGWWGSSNLVLTPHPGEFKRLFPDISPSDRLTAARSAARASGAIVVLKGAKVAIANPEGTVWVNPDSTPALARGGTGDVLTGLMGGLMAQAAVRQVPFESAIRAAVWWHARAGRLGARRRTELGVDAFSLTQDLHGVFAEIDANQTGI